MTTPTSLTLVGATGLTGSHTFKSLLASPHAFNITTITRRATETGAPANPLTKVASRLFPSLLDAPADKERLVESGGVYVSCLGTTRAAAGGTAEQEKIDLVLNRDLAKRAKEDGASTIILVSSVGASPDSRMFYPRIKGQLEADVKALAFDRTVILRPAALLGARTESRPAEYIAQNLFRGLRKVGLPMDSLAIDAEDVGACIAHLAANPPTEKLLVINDHEIIANAKLYRAAQPTSA
ncbi:hypothetical protein B9479_008015 [Cryptococcus floricola]|uniref:NAD(P)-binding domain-containing protein n=1 Tax=Cryptococcus floricola TaxID=2591691 RepID=A0A5D3AKU0_9TREE|nr:hypothetical protein B9479_008015 [Cryptococcus floricola]